MHFIVQMWSGRSSAIPRLCNDLTGLHPVIGFHKNLGEVAVERGQTIAVFYNDAVTITAFLPCKNHFSGCGTIDGAPKPNSNIQPFVKLQLIFFCRRIDGSVFVFFYHGLAPNSGTVRRFRSFCSFVVFRRDRIFSDTKVR